MTLRLQALLLTAVSALACRGTDAAPDARARTEAATLGAGCFWCAEAALEQLDGVEAVTSGFMGGGEADPDDATALIAAGHAEVVQVRFDPGLLPYEELLTWFWRIHDPTSVNRQGEDEGPEYRSVIFVHGPDQRAVAEASRLAIGRRHDRPIVTTIEEAGRFYPASEKHQDYYAKNRAGQYCREVIAPHLLRVGLDD